MTVVEQDVETRARLLTAAARLFAAHGFAHVTIRDICGAAHANIAAVNYHFAGKSGLYDEVVGLAIRTMQETTIEAQKAGEHKSAEERLRTYVNVLLTRVVGSEDEGWIHHIMLRELSDPTPALARVVAEVIKPRMAYLESIVAELLGCDTSDPRAARCAFSVHAQCMALMNRALAKGAIGGSSAFLGEGAHAIATMVDHITEFSLAGLWALARST